jgi:uncharacterized membrane protein
MNTKSTTTLIGILFILVGIVALAYQGFTYTKHEDVGSIGNLQVSENTQKTVYFPPALGGLSLVAGVVLVLVGRKNLK